jgi:urease accessory protein
MVAVESPAMMAAAEAAPGRGTLAFARYGDRTIVRCARAQSPLRLLLPRNHGHASWVMLATLGGGLVDGDTIHLDIAVGADATGLVGTQASTKVYRCPTSACRQDTAARVAEGALLIAIPDPVACFASARYEQSTRIDLASSGSLVLVDAFTSGRAARGERWDFHHYAARTAIDRAGVPLLRDAILLDPAHGGLPGRMGRFDAFATMVLAGPRVLPLVQAARDLSAPSRRASVVSAASPLGEDAVVLRIAGESVEDVTRAVRSHLTELEALLGDDPFARKW